MEHISKLIEEYLIYCKDQKKLSPNTLRAYQIDMTQFIIFLKKKGLESSPASEIDKKALHCYISELLKTYAARSCKRKIACLKAFFNHLEYEDIIVVNPFRKLRINIKEPRILPKTIKKQDVSVLLDHAYHRAASANTTYTTFMTSRAVAITELLLATGIRIGEACRLKVEDIDFQDKSIRIVGKGDKERIVYLTSNTVLKALHRYLSVRNSIHSNSSFFFTGWKRPSLFDGAIRNIIRNTAQSVLKKRITPHMYRHTFATLLLEHNVDICYIQHLLGHSSVKTTQIYLHLSNNSIREALSKAHIRERLIPPQLKLLSPYLI